MDYSPPAFPISQNVEPPKYFQGMTLRDYFAAKAMQGLLSGQLISNEKMKTGAEVMAENAYFVADAMLKAREAKS